MSSGEPARLRAFVAVSLPPSLCRELARLAAEIAGGRPQVRCVRPDAMHLTLQFLGHVEPPRLEEFRRRLQAELAAVPAFRVRVSGVGAFPNARQPRVVWAGADHPELGALAGHVGRAAQAAGIPVESRPFRGHVTLARLRAPLRDAELTGRILRHREDVFGEVDVREVVAFRSELRPGGAVYTKLWTIGLIPSTQGA